ncbi:MAG: T9SS type A sorting domain-containing protein [candidate division KSB1 bacterium]|nr:T9SS type A sorting domain-containing protein [candidate division KSB1 bacterium]
MRNFYSCVLGVIVIGLGGFAVRGQAAGEIHYTFVHTEDIGHIAVRLEMPDTPRYSEGAPVVVEVSTWFVMYNEFHRVNDTRRIGAVTVSYLWPGRRDAATGMQSDGEYDYGGPDCLAALRDVIRFAAGQMPDTSGLYIDDYTDMTVLTGNLGLFASSHAGVMGTNVLAYFGHELPAVDYFIGRENPTRDEMYPLELGHFEGAPRQSSKVRNPFFNEADYSPDTVQVDYSTLDWYGPEGNDGRPYFKGTDSKPEYIMAPDKNPTLWGKRCYSRALTRALLDNGVFTLQDWPADVAKPREADAWWEYRTTVDNYPLIGEYQSGLKVMLVFSRYDHVQAADSKPHIHQAWDGFWHTAGLWVRMNPDRCYAQSVNPDYRTAFPDNPANHEPDDWFTIEEWGFPADNRVRKDIWLASVAEMADRVYSNDWRSDLDQPVRPVLVEEAVSAVQSVESAPGGMCALIDNYPNPFNPATVIRVSVEKSEPVDITVWNIRGHCVARLHDGYLSAGAHRFVWEAHGMPVGVYFCRMDGASVSASQRMLLVK